MCQGQSGGKRRPSENGTALAENANLKKLLDNLKHGAEAVAGTRVGAGIWRRGAVDAVLNAFKVRTTRQNGHAQPVLLFNS
jgi:hypothetical protein